MPIQPESAPSGATAAPSDDDHPELAAANAQAGLWLFAVYLALYAGFVGLSAFAPELMARTPFGGLNLAVLYGFFLIVAALTLALIYMAACRRAAGRHSLGERDR
ncbi:DUF485 domain-containing protein [Singulisphaera sp. Ch08]|uniref:DUF485 domain-containing protein n=1 Tax=Singulisphaera sp. Ch08 TaxID=3120278 RepID=A0AAU7C8L3_9BACT